MAGSDPPFDPDATLRQDRSTRKIIDRLDRQLGPPPEPGVPSIRDEVLTLKASTLRTDRIFALLGAAASIIVTAAWSVQALNLKRMQETHVEQMRQFTADVHRELDRAAVYSRASYAVTVEKRPPETVAKEVRTGTLDAGAR